MKEWLRASHEADRAYQLFSTKKDCPDPQSASKQFNDAKIHLQNSAALLPEGRMIVDLYPPSIPFPEIYGLLAKVRLGTETTAMTKLLAQVNVLESQLHEMTAKHDGLKRKASSDMQIPDRPRTRIRTRFKARPI
jgi:hypothetical protein